MQPSSLEPRRARFAATSIAATLTAFVALASRPALAGDTWTDPFPGVRRLYRTTSKPLRVHALVVDLCTPGVQLRATKSSERKRTVSSFAGLTKVEAAINGDFFSYANYDTTGLAKGAGEKWPGSTDDSSSGFLAFGPGLATISMPSAVVASGPEGALHIVSGHPAAASKGKPVKICASHYCQDEPRTGAGFSRDRRTLYLVVVDGRSPSSKGVTVEELGKIMIGLGAYDGMNLDGGGSSTMWVKGKGVVNAPSDGGERVVANHLGIHSQGIAGNRPASCPESAADELAHGLADLDATASSDVDGDGKADACARGAKGLVCHPSTGAGFGAAISLGALSDDEGFGAVSRASTLRMGDIDGDGRDDVCARGANGVVCFRAQEGGFGPAIDGPAWSDDAGFDQVSRYSTIRLADVTGDGKADLCARESAGFRCYASAGSKFESTPIEAAPLTDDAGWDSAARSLAIRMGDVDGDGRADVCAREPKGMACWLARDGAWEAVAGPAWSDESGWADLDHASTVRLADVDGDGRADACGRASKGFRCHISTGAGFGPAIDLDAFSDGAGWDDQANYLTIRMGDIDGDGRADVCARADAHIVCHRSTGNGFGPAIEGPVLSDAKHWYAHRYFRTIRLADVTGDGKADLCARAGSGVRCYPSTGDGFGEPFSGPEWSDEKGWSAPAYHASIRIAGPSRPKAGGGAAASAASAGSGAGAGPSGGGGSTGQGAFATGGASSDGSSGGSSGGAEESGGCGCRVTGAELAPGPGRAQWACAVALAMLGLMRSRRQSGRARAIS